jgi:uncharacterized protein
MTPADIRRPFSLRLYLLIVVALSWPFQIAFILLGDSFRPLLLVSMLMAGVATFLCGRYVFRDGFAGAGWSWGRPIHYALALVLALFLWLLPSAVERGFGIHAAAAEVTPAGLLSTFALSFAVTLLPAFSEELSWRGYLLPRLFSRHSPRKALLLHGAITWLWHLPVVIVLGMQTGLEPLLAIPAVLLVSFVPTVMHAIVFAYIWSRSASLPVATFYHSAFDEVRDTLEGTVGLGPLGQNFQMLALTVLGLLALFRANWSRHAAKPV